MSEFLALNLPELRHRLEAHQATRPTDIFSPEMKPWMKKKDSIAFAIELKEAEAAQKPFYITVPPQPIERPVQPLLRLRKAKEPTHPAPEEARMPRSNPTHHRSPQARIEHLVERIQAATRKGEKLYWAQQEIRDLCKAHSLDVPPEAQKRERGTTKQDAPPHQLETASGQEAAMPLEPGDAAINPIMEERSFSYVQRLVLKRISILNDVSPSREEWRQIARDLAILETTAGAARQIAERHAEVA